MKMAEGKPLEAAEAFFPGPPCGFLAFDEVLGRESESRSPFPGQRTLSSWAKDPEVPPVDLAIEGALAPTPVGIPRLTGGVFIAEPQAEKSTGRAKAGRSLRSWLRPRK
jgi:hypothetical protein